MSWRLFFGIGLIVIGGGFLLDQLDILEFGPLLATWWPMIIILIGVIQLATQSVPVAAGILVIVLGAFFQIDRLDVIDINLGQVFWPALLIVVGGYLLLTRTGRRSPMLDSEDALNSFVLFGGVDRKLESQSFQGGSAIAIFGGSEIDLRDARLHAEGAELDLAVAFGGMEVMVPEDWRIRMSGLPIFGGWSNKTRPRDDAAAEGPVLNVRCVAAFGGIEVHN
jgi:predicted membrane protein